MSIDMLNINYSLLLAEISSSYSDGNGRHGNVANIPHLLDLYSNRVPAPGRPPAPGRAKSLRDNCTTFNMRVSEQVFCHPYLAENGAEADENGTFFGFLGGAARVLE